MEPVQLREKGTTPWIQQEHKYQYGRVDAQEANSCLTFQCVIWAEHCHPQHDVVSQSEGILHQMHGAIGEDADKQALQQPPEGVEPEEQLHQDSGQLWDCRQDSHQTPQRRRTGALEGL